MAEAAKSGAPVRLPHHARFRNLVVSVDRNGLLWVTEFRHPYINRAMELCSRAGDWDVWTAALTTMLAIPGKPRRVGLRVLPRLLGALAICYSLKRAARRLRPSVSVEGFSTLVADPDPYSFPSSHSATSWAAYVTMARSLGGLGWLLVVPAVLVSYSRMHVGAHYPLDVLIGTGVGVGVAFLGRDEMSLCIAARS